MLKGILFQKLFVLQFIIPNMTHKRIETYKTAHGLRPRQFNNTRNQFIDNLIVANGEVFITRMRNESAGVTLIRIIQPRGSC